MNKLKLLFAGLFFVILTLGTYSCSKDDSGQSNTAPVLTKNRSSLPSVINGMLHFDSYTDFKQYIEQIEDLEGDSSQVASAYIDLGVDITQEFLPNLTDYPVALRMEQQLFGFTSARKSEEDIINAALNSGNDSIFSIVSDPFLKSVLNTEMAAHIGTRIFKFYDNGGVAIVLNNDWVKYDSIKNLSYDELRQDENLIVTNDSPDSWGSIFNVGMDGKISTEKLYTPSQPIDAESPRACDFSNSIRVTTLNNNTIRFEVGPRLFPGSIRYEWKFADGSIKTGNVITIDCGTQTSGVVEITAWVIDPSVPGGRWLRCTAKINFLCGCGEKKEKPKREEWSNAGGSGKRIRIDARIWVKDGEIGCRSRHFGRNFVGIWVPLNLIHNTIGVFANIQGSFVRENSPGNCIIINQPFNEKQLPPGNNASWQNIISHPGKNFVDPGKLSSGHRIRLKTGGTFFGFGVDRPRLILD